MSLETKDVIEACRKRPLFVACGAVALAALLLFYFRSGAPTELQGKLDESEKRLKKLGNNVTYSAQLDAQLSELKAVNETIESGALRPLELARNQQVFFRLEQDTGVKILEIRQEKTPAVTKPQPAAKGPAAPVSIFVPVVYILSVQGDYAQLMTFLKRVEKGVTLARISSASFQQQFAGSQTVNITVRLLGLRS
jgi:hypothetical protein